MEKQLNVRDLWIGDYLLLRKSGRIGRYDGQASNGKIRVKLTDKTVLTTLSNVEITDEPTTLATASTPKVRIPVLPTTTKLEDSIDLHIHILAPHMVNALPERIVDYQVKAAQNFLEKSIHQGVRKIEIIHGKGTGVLKSEVRHLLGLYDEIQFQFEKNQGGSTEVWLK